MASPPPDNATLAKLQQQIHALPQSSIMQHVQNVEAILKKDRKNPQHWFVLGSLFIRAGAFQQSLEALRTALKLHRKSEVILGAIAFLFAEKAKDYKESLVYLEQKFALNNKDPKTLFLIANCQLELGQPDLALDTLDQAAPLTENQAKIHALKAQCNIRLGDSKSARDNYRKVQELDPGAAFAMIDKIAALPDNSKKQLQELELQLKGVLVNQVSKFRHEQHRVAATAVLGEITEKLGNHQEAFDHYVAANELQKTFAAQSDWEKSFELLRGTFSSEVFEQVDVQGHPSEEQIFVVGMVRSGTTLIESILAGLDGVRDFGELEYMVPELHRFGVDGISGPNRGATIETLQSQVLQAPEGGFAGIGSRYIDSFNFQKYPGVKKIDKMPSNFLALGLIALVFPKAKIIHCRRNPIDCALSIYKNPLSGYHESYANDLTKIAKYYRNYEELMRHWKSVLPLKIHDIFYEDLVTNPGLVGAELAEATGLVWDAKALDHTRAKKDVQTASQWQVRKEIYQTSVEKWRIYEKQLKPVIDELVDLIQNYSEELSSKQQG